MQLDSKILGLPTSILFLITAYTTAGVCNGQLLAQRANNAPRDVGWVDSSTEQRASHDTKSMQPAPHRSPMGVMKMSEDPGEKFYMEYWQYEEPLQSIIPGVGSTQALRVRDIKQEMRLLANASASIPYRAPFALHTEDTSNYHELRARGHISSSDAAAVLATLQKREFLCPTGTAACSSIGYPNSCCGTDEACYQVQDTGLGPVGCCPYGVTCAGTITDCDAPNTPCIEKPGVSYEGGGCCIPNYVCAGVGCVPSPVSSSTPPIQTSSETPPSTTSTTPTTTLSASGTSSTPISTDTSTAATGVPPNRPTGTSTAPPTSVTWDSCPTGYYPCEAYYAGGCCRTGRNCETTYCPSANSITIISDGTTIVVPEGPAATVAAPSVNCASGWSSCAASLGGDCCPNGWQCGAASCTSVSPSQTDVGQKQSPSTGVRNAQSKLGVLIGGLSAVLVWM